MKQRSKKSSEELNPDKNTASKVNNKAKLPVKLVAKRPTKVVLLFFVLAFYGAWGVYYYQFDNLPGPLSLEHVGKRGFSEHESFKHVKALTDLGPHTVGSDALDSALEYVYEASQAIKKGAFWEVDVEVDLFHANSGANQMKGGLFNGKTLVYSDLTHIVLRISPKYGSEGKEKAILVSSHIDTVFSTEGAGDCSSCVAVMLELARGVSQWAHGFKNSIIFLFNTGEEEGLNGAHSFITQHPWSDTIQVAIDLEAMGIGGKSGIFQAGPHPWAMEIYGAVAKHPSGQIVAQDLFNSGAIKSATDFQVYKEVAGLSGLDFAYADHTAVYHTKNDKLSLLRPGSLQHLGDNMLAFLLQAGASADLPKANEEAPGGTSEHDPATYFDILGMYMIVYRQNFATILYNSIIAQTLLILALSLFMGGFPAIISLLLSFASVLLMWMFSISFASSIACILPFISSNPVPYVAHPWLVIGLFGGPGLIGAFIGQHVGFVLLEMYCEHVFVKRGNVGPGDIDVLAKLEAERWVFKGGLIQWLVLLIIGNYFRVGSVYLAVFWLVSPAFAYGLLEATLSPARLPKPLKSITLLLGLSLPFTLTSGMAIRLASTIIGSSVRFERSPGTMPEWLSNLIVAIYVAAVICLTMVYLLSYIHISGAKVPIIGVSCILLILSLGLVYTGMVPPFTEDTSRAVNVVHVIDATENQEPVANILLFSSTPGDLLKEVKHIDEDFYCGKNKSLDFVTFTMKYGCWMNKGAENGWSRSNIPILSIESDVKSDERVTEVLINTKESIRWVLGINFEAIEDFTLRDDIEELISSGEKSSVDGWHTIQFSGGRKSSTKFILTLFWAKNYTFKGDNKKKEPPLLKLRTDLPLVTPPVENVLEKLPPWCSLFGKSTSPHTLSFLNTLPLNL